MEFTEKVFVCLERKTWAGLLGCVAEIGEVKNYFFKFWRRSQGIEECGAESKQEQKGEFESQLRKAGV